MLFSILTNDMFFSVMVIQTCKTIQMTTFNIPVQEFLMRLWELKKDFLVLLNMRFYKVLQRLFSIKPWKCYSTMLGNNNINSNSKIHFICEVITITENVLHFVTPWRARRIQNRHVDKIQKKLQNPVHIRCLPGF